MHSEKEPSPESKTQRAKRLEITKETAKKLFAHSGNQCAFPNCTRLIIDGKGQFIAQLCHIEAAEPGGERFNSAMDNEQRRNFSNLLLLCYEHHVVTNNVVDYPVERLQRMKREHEERYTTAIDSILAISNAGPLPLIADDRDFMPFSPPATMQAFLAQDNPPASAPDQVREVMAILRNIPARTRSFASICLGRAEMSEGPFGWVCAPLHEVENAISTSFNGSRRSLRNDIAGHLETLRRYDVGINDEEGHFCFRKYRRGEDPDWNVWGAIRQFCESKGISLHRVIVDLRFDLLD